MGRTARVGGRLVRRQPLLLIALGITFFGGLWSEGFERLWHAHFLLDVGLPELGGLAAFWTIGLARQLASPIYDT